MVLTEQIGSRPGRPSCLVDARHRLLRSPPGPGTMRCLGMFDWYEPVPPVLCPTCGAVTSGWQGKDGPNALFVWRQGFAHPVSQRVDDPIEDERLREFALPAEFQLWTHCPAGHELLAEGSSQRGVWTATTLETDEAAIRGPAVVVLVGLLTLLPIAVVVAVILALTGSDSDEFPELRVGSCVSVAGPRQHIIDVECPAGNGRVVSVGDSTTDCAPTARWGIIRDSQIFCVEQTGPDITSPKNEI